MTLKERLFDSVAQASSEEDIDRVTARRCTSDRFNGIEYTFYGKYIPIRPIIETVRQTNGVAIEQFSHTTEGEEPRLIVFVAEIPEVEYGFVQ